MKFGTQRNKRRAAGFTLAEALAALMFMAIVIPVAVEVLHIASLSGEVAARKSAAARVADRVLNGNIVLANTDQGTQSGTVSEGTLDFRWTMTSQSWLQDAMKILTVEVTYSAQGKDYSVKMSTLTDSQTTSPMQTLQQQ